MLTEPRGRSAKGAGIRVAGFPGTGPARAPGEALRPLGRARLPGAGAGAARPGRGQGTCPYCPALGPAGPGKL